MVYFLFCFGNDLDCFMCCFLSLSFSCFRSFVLPMNFVFVFVVVVWVYTLSTFALI